jgi:tetratricopeptide (TPR) repeat protein
MRRRIALQSLLAGSLCWGAFAQSRDVYIDFLNERLNIPDSQLFVEADYIESGIGLRYGIDKRLSYFPGQYEEAARAFHESVQGYRYKADIWVFLARSYFYMRNPQKAKATIELAAKVMPDLSKRFWDPLLRSMLGEIRKRAERLQTQVDFYSPSTGDFLALFRLYKFLHDYPACISVIHAAGDKADSMRDLAEMASSENQRTYRGEATKWDDLAGSMQGELETLGVDVVQRPDKEITLVDQTSGVVDPQLLDDTKILQMKVDYYQSKPVDYRQLYDNYLKLNMPDRAQMVIGALDREIKRVRFLADTATDFVQEDQYLVEASTLVAMREELKAEIDAVGAGAAP